MIGAPLRAARSDSTARSPAKQGRSSRGPALVSQPLPERAHDSPATSVLSDWMALVWNAASARRNASAKAFASGASGPSSTAPKAV